MAPSPQTACLRLALAIPLLFQLSHAQDLSYTTSLVTDCISSSMTTAMPAPGILAGAPGSSPSGITVGPNGILTVNMPACPECDCPTCAHTSTYTTTLGVFYAPSSTGAKNDPAAFITSKPYTVAEVYSGMSSFPTFAAPTGPVPFGFTTGLVTCDVKVCGSGVSATMTFPSGGAPYAGAAVGTGSGGKVTAGSGRVVVWGVGVVLGVGAAVVLG